MQLTIIFCFILFGYSCGITIGGGKPTRHHRVKRIVGGQPALQPPPDDPVVFARMYNRDARVEGFRNVQTGLYSFLGIRYADPPIGSNRFARPFYRRLQGDINATKYGPPCPQPDFDNPMRIIGHEDCLLLNVFTPHMPDESTGLPVYVWIHGGGFRYGSANQFGAEPLTQKGVLFVPVQYRLGTLGIIGEANKDFNGNLAMFDMEAALRWVTEYISFFGGDPKQIKVIGHGSGASSAMYLTMSQIPRSRSISGTVSMSGSALSQYSLDKEPVQSLEEIAMINECPTTNETEIVGCLRNKRAEDIVLRDSAIETERLQGRAMIQAIAGSVGFNPHVETEDDRRGLPGFITREPNVTLKSKRFRKVPLLIGVAKDETAHALTIEGVTKIWGTAENFLKSLLGELLNLKGLLSLDAITGEIVNPILPGLGDAVLSLTDYLKIPKGLRVDQVLTKLTEATTDILFNLPAVLSADLWSSVAPAYLYSFEHVNGSTSGRDFLGQLPIVSGSGDTENYTAHGDELGYLFDVNDIFGNPIPEKRLKTEADLRVRNSFTELLAQFALLGTESKSNGGLFQAFSRKGAPFIKITEKLQIGADFRFCSLSLLGVPLEALKSLTCEGLLKNLSPLTNVAGNLGGQLTNTLGLGGVLGSGGGAGSAAGAGLLGGNKDMESTGGGLLGTGLLGGSSGNKMPPNKKKPNKGIGLLGL